MKNEQFICDKCHHEIKLGPELRFELSKPFDQGAPNHFCSERCLCLWAMALPSSVLIFQQLAQSPLFYKAPESQEKGPVCDLAT